MLFAKGKRPERHALKAFADREPLVSVSHDPLLADISPAEALLPERDHWIELLRQGLTFDLSGLAPGPASAFPELAHRFDVAELPTVESHEPVVLRPGPHLAGGRSSMPLMRGLLALGCELVRQFEDATAVAWGPTGAVIGRRFFESVTTAWLEGGPFPALGLTAFIEAPDGALESVGLGFWIGQEVWIEPSLSGDRVAATRLGIRLINHLVILGGIAEADRIVAPDGTRLVLHPSCDRAVVSVRRE